MSGALRAAARLWLTLRHRILGRRHGRLVMEELDGASLLVLPAVFNPVLFRTGALLARTVAERYPPGTAEGRRALDMGTGSGIGGIFAAQGGFRVVGVDINPEAVRCARINALLNRVEERMEVRAGDLFEPVAGERYHLVLFNPPFFRGTPRDPLDQAWRSEDAMERFARALPEHLAPEGEALIVLSTDGEGSALLDALAGSGLEYEAVARRDLVNEVATVYAVRAAPGAGTRSGAAGPRGVET